MTGCPNGCARPYLAEIGLVGRTPGKYNLYLGAAFDGSRLNKLYRKDVGHDEIVAALTPLIASYAKERLRRRAVRRLRDPAGPRRGDHCRAATSMPGSRRNWRPPERPPAQRAASSLVRSAGAAGSAPARSARGLSLSIAWTASASALMSAAAWELGA